MSAPGTEPTVSSGYTQDNSLWQPNYTIKTSQHQYGCDLCRGSPRESVYGITPDFNLLENSRCLGSPWGTGDHQSSNYESIAHRLDQRFVPHRLLKMIKLHFLNPPTGNFHHHSCWQKTHRKKAQHCCPSQRSCYRKSE